MEHFTPDARELIARATVLAGRNKHCEVCPEHLLQEIESTTEFPEHHQRQLEALREDTRENWKGPRGQSQELGFSTRTKRLLQAAYELAPLAGEVSRAHIVQAMLADWEPVPGEWKSSSSDILNLLGPSLQAALQSRGVDTASLSQVDLSNVSFGEDFLRSDSARRLTNLSLQYNASDGGPILLYLLSLLLQGGEAGEELSRAGLSEALLTDVLSHLPEAGSPISEVFETMLVGSSPLLEKLEVRDIRLDLDSQKAVRMAEFISRHEEVAETDTEHLLSGLILVGCFSPPPRGAVKLLSDLGALGSLQSGGQTYVGIYEGNQPVPPASELLQEAFAEAVGSALGQPELGTQHLLLGLARLGRGEAFKRLSAEAVTGEVIAAYLER